MKFSKTMCRRCNNDRSQPIDQAYDRLCAFLHDREQRILSNRIFDLRQVYGSDWSEQRHNVLRYYAKHAACRIANNKLSVPDQVREYIGGGRPPNCMKFDCEIREDISTMANDLRRDDIPDGSLWNGALIVMKSQSSGDISGANSFYGYRWFRMYWGIDESWSGFEEPFTEPIVVLKSA